jgi:hypothetical protein
MTHCVAAETDPQVGVLAFLSCTGGRTCVHKLTPEELPLCIHGSHVGVGGVGPGGTLRRGAGALLVSERAPPLALSVFSSFR